MSNALACPTKLCAALFRYLSLQEGFYAVQTNFRPKSEQLLRRLVKTTISRRKFLAYAGVLAASGAAAHQLTLSSNSPIELVHTPIAVPDLPSSFDGYRIGFLSDIHLGVYTPPELLERAVRQLVSADIDLLLLGGDYHWISDSGLAELIGMARSSPFVGPESPELAAQIVSTVADLVQVARPRDGIYGIVGNHDRWTGATQCSKLFAKRGIDILVNRVVSIALSLIHI